MTVSYDFVEPGRVELPISRVSDVRSNRLSYGSMLTALAFAAVVRSTISGCRQLVHTFSVLRALFLPVPHEKADHVTEIQHRTMVLKDRAIDGAARTTDAAT